MSKNPEEAVKETAKKTLSKYTTTQLTKKLEDGKLFGVSHEVALEILAKREVDTSKFQKVAKSDSKQTPAVTGYTKKIVKDPKIEAAKLEADKEIEDETEEKKEKKKREVKEIDTDTKKKILDLNKEGKSIYFIRKQLGLPWSAVNKVING